LKDLKTSELNFGRGCTGEMWAYSNQTIRGTLLGFPDTVEVEFEGMRGYEEGVGEREMGINFRASGKAFSWRHMGGSET
jgi:hypothetical protein